MDIGHNMLGGNLRWTSNTPSDFMLQKPGWQLWATRLVKTLAFYLPKPNIQLFACFMFFLQNVPVYFQSVSYQHAFTYHGSCCRRLFCHIPLYNGSCSFQACSHMLKFLSHTYGLLSHIHPHLKIKQILNSAFTTKIQQT